MEVKTASHGNCRVNYVGAVPDEAPAHLAAKGHRGAVLLPAFYRHPPRSGAGLRRLGQRRQRGSVPRRAHLRPGLSAGSSDLPGSCDPSGCLGAVGPPYRRPRRPAGRSRLPGLGGSLDAGDRSILDPRLLATEHRRRADPGRPRRGEGRGVAQAIFAVAQLQRTIQQAAGTRTVVCSETSISVARAFSKAWTPGEELVSSASHRGRL